MAKYKQAMYVGFTPLLSLYYLGVTTHTLLWSYSSCHQHYMQGMGTGSSLLSHKHLTSNQINSFFWLWWESNPQRLLIIAFIGIGELNALLSQPPTT